MSAPGTASMSPLRGTGAAPSASSSAIESYARPSAGFEDRLRKTEAVLLAAAATHRVVQASSLGAEDMVITHLINKRALTVPVFVLDTGLLHAETLALLTQLKAQQTAHPHAPLTVYQPQQESVLQFVEREGHAAMYKSVELRKSCCAIRKLEPLERALAGYDAWITGMRREQSGERAQVPLIDDSQSSAGGRIKYNPLADWSWGDVWHYIALNSVRYNPLHDRFFPSIGCAPCTRAISLGEDFRAGRWWWEGEAQKECGLHVQALPAQTSHEEKKEGTTA